MYEAVVCNSVNAEQFLWQMPLVMVSLQAKGLQVTLC